jgi:hypothetical protein
MTQKGDAEHAHPSDSRQMRRTVSTLLVIVATVAAVVIVTHTAPAFAKAAAIPTNIALGDKARASAQDALHALTIKSGAADSQWYRRGVWHYSGTPCWFCATGPGTLAATLWRVNGRRDKALLRKATATFDRAISEHKNPDGSFGNRNLPETQFFGVELGTTYLLLGNHLGNERRASWKAAIEGGASYLIRSKNLTWEANGNINLGQAEYEWLAWAITGKARFRQAYELAWKYAIDPPQSRWPGYGLHLTHSPSVRMPGGAGYLAENGGSGPGFDPEYSMLQLSVASRAFLLSGDPRFGRITDLLWNQLSPLIERSSWLIDARNGTRRSHIDAVTTPGLVVLAQSGKRPDLAKFVDAQTTSGMYATYLSNARDNIGNAGYFRGYGNELGVALLALAAPPVADGPRSLSARDNAESTTHKRPVRRVRAKVLRKGVRVWWKVSGAPGAAPARVDISVDGHRALRLHGATALLHLSAGLHQITVSMRGAPSTAATAVVTVPDLR